MKFKVQVVVLAEEGEAETPYEVAVLEKDCQQIEQLGLTLTEAKQLLAQIQQHVVEAQITAYLNRTTRHSYTPMATGEVTT